MYKLALNYPKIRCRLTRKSLCLNFSKIRWRLTRKYLCLLSLSHSLLFPPSRSSHLQYFILPSIHSLYGPHHYTCRLFDCILIWIYLDTFHATQCSLRIWILIAFFCNEANAQVDVLILKPCWPTLLAAFIHYHVFIRCRLPTIYL